MSIDLPAALRDQLVTKLGLNRTEAARAMSVSARLVDSLIADQNSGFPVVRINSRVVIPVKELREWLSGRIGASR